MAREVRTFAEGSLRHVQASGTGGWATAATPVSALMGFVQAGLGVNSGRNVITVMERGFPHHHKVIGANPIEVQFTYIQAVTANMAKPATASGASTPQVHLELKSVDAEVAAASGQYWQFHNCVLLTQQVTEGENGNTIQETWRALSMIGPTASGWLG